MRQFALALEICLLCLAVVKANFAEDGIDHRLWKALPVHSGGRWKSLDSLARETLREITQSGSLTDPGTDQPLDPTEAYLLMLLDWRGWEHANRGNLELVTDWHPLYFHLHEPDRWDRLPLLRVEQDELCFALGLNKNVTHISPHQLATTTIEDRRTERRLPFPTWAQKLLTMQQTGEELTEVEKSAVELARRLWLYQDHRMGRGLVVLTFARSAGANSLSVAQLLLTRFDEGSDPSGELRNCQELLRLARQSYQQHDAEAFIRASEQFLASLQHVKAIRHESASPWAIGLELAYNRYMPFRWSWALMLAAALGMWLHSVSARKSIYVGALAAYVAGLLAVVVGFVLRMAIAGHSPVTNMYESVIYVAAGVAVLGLALQLAQRKKLILPAAASVTTALLAVADCCPLVLDPTVRPLEPILRSNFWLVAHVMTITLSYSAFALALGLANITLGHYLLGSTNRPAIRSLSRYTQTSIQAGVVMLAAGIVLGAIWADQAWGRLWGWDPKEVWALVALLSYGAVLHARQAGWVGHRGLASGAVACFCVVMMAWYIDSTLGSGLHRYGPANGGQSYVCAAVILQLLLVGTALLRSWYLDAERCPGSRPTVTCLSASQGGISPT